MSEKDFQEYAILFSKRINETIITPVEKSTRIDSSILRKTMTAANNILDDVVEIVDLLKSLNMLLGENGKMIKLICLELDDILEIFNQENYDLADMHYHVANVKELIVELNRFYSEL